MLIRLSSPFRCFNRDDQERFCLHPFAWGLSTGLVVATLALGASAWVSGHAWADEHATESVAPQEQPQSDGPIRYERIDYTTEDGPVRGFVGFVDLSDRRVDVVVTEPMSGKQKQEVADEHPAAEAVLTATDAWATEHDLMLAVNANFYGIVHRPEGLADVIGLSVSDGQTISEIREYEGQPDPVAAFTRQRRLVIAPGDKALLRQTVDGVAGVGASSRSATPGTLLVTDGENTGITSRVDPTRRHPRTAIGVDKLGQKVIIVVIDGRQPDHSIGINLPDLADLMIKYGADDAINLDGGGSSSFVYRQVIDQAVKPTSSDKSKEDKHYKLIVNSPSDGHFRKVANHLGFRLVHRGSQIEGDQDGQAKRVRLTEHESEVENHSTETVKPNPAS